MIKNYRTKTNQCLTPDVTPFLPVNKSLINEGNYNNPETINTSQYEKDDTSHTKREYFIANVKDMKNTNYDDKYKEDNSKYQYGNESVDSPETSDNSSNESAINTTKEE